MQLRGKKKKSWMRLVEWRRVECVLAGLHVLTSSMAGGWDWRLEAGTSRVVALQNETPHMQVQEALVRS